MQDPKSRSGFEQGIFPAGLTARAAPLDDAARVLNDWRLKLRVGNGSKSFDALGWRKGQQTALPGSGDAIDLAFTLDENTYQGFSPLQMIVRDLRMDGAGSRAQKARRPGLQLDRATQEARFKRAVAACIKTRFRAVCGAKAIGRGAGSTGAVSAGKHLAPRAFPDCAAGVRAYYARLLAVRQAPNGTDGNFATHFS